MKTALHSNSVPRKVPLTSRSGWPFDRSTSNNGPGDSRADHGITLLAIFHRTERIPTPSSIGAVNDGAVSQAHWP
jgi:hypothetical protein